MPRRNILDRSPSRLAGTCPEIILTVMRLSGPADLKLLASVSPVFKSILDANPSVWKYSRASLMIPAPTAVGRLGRAPAVDHDVRISARGVTEEMFIDYLFRGGHCSVCGIWTLEFPCSFALDFRCCSKDCRRAVFSVNAKLVVTIKKTDLVQHPGVQWLTPHPVPRGGMYLRADVASAKKRDKAVRRACKTHCEFEYVDDFATYLAECQFQTFESLEQWKPEYLRAVAKTRSENLKFLKTIARAEAKAARLLLASPTLHRIFTAFNRDLTKMCINDWRVIQLQVRRELQALRYREDDIQLRSGQGSN
ncbi:hypothetical protein B0H11DRAFT_2092670 [Mycena galericulata]|nr:hypothetical protein B0H11DRAFT_2092658 [Mycena galericulata]KAJ7443338.1 hypothetical protein B0H11DRAFT_2092670 [Mycena galericulata]